MPIGVFIEAKFNKPYCQHMKEILVRDDTRNITICRVSVDAILDLRHRILRAGLPKDSAQFPGDEITSTWHLAAFNFPAIDALPISCASFMLNTYRDQSAWQLRGMASDHVFFVFGFVGVLFCCFVLLFVVV